MTSYLVPRAAAPSPRPAVRRLLLVEGDYEIRTLVRRFLEHHGFECRCAADADTAERWVSGSERIDLAIVAECLQSESGFGALARLRTASPELPLLLLRGFAGVDQEANRAEAARFGARFLPRPIRLLSILETVESMIAAQQQAAPRPAVRTVSPAAGAVAVPSARVASCVSMARPTVIAAGPRTTGGNGAHGGNPFQAA